MDLSALVPALKQYTKDIIWCGLFGRAQINTLCNEARWRFHNDSFEKHMSVNIISTIFMYSSCCKIFLDISD